jgi:hypothetical protein
MKRMVTSGVMALAIGVSVGAYSKPTPPPVEHRGCCSHHGGECGCKNGHDLCCDGSLSPSYGCLST